MIFFILLVNGFMSSLLSRVKFDSFDWLLSCATAARSAHRVTNAIQPPASVHVFPTILASDATSVLQDFTDFHSAPLASAMSRELDQINVRMAIVCVILSPDSVLAR